MFVAGSVLCGLAPAMIALVVGRGIQGIGGGMISGVVHGLIREVFPARLWPRMLATVSVAWGVAALMGPLVGGLFAQYGHWRWAFLSMVPVVIVTAALAARLLPAGRRRHAKDEAFPVRTAPVDLRGRRCAWPRWATSRSWRRACCSSAPPRA